MRKILKFLFIILFSSCEGAKIFGYFPTPSISHQVVLHALMKDLASRGHQLTILTTDIIKPLTSNPNVTQIDLHNTYEVMRRNFNFVDIKNDKKDEYEIIEMFIPVLMEYIDEQLSSPDVKKLIELAKPGDFDLVIFEHMMFDVLLAFGEIFNSPVIGLTSIDTLSHVHRVLGNEANPAIHSELMFPFKHGTLNFFERWRSLYYQMRYELFLVPELHRNFREILMKKHFPRVTQDFDVLHSRVALLMTNTNPAMGFIRPLLPNTIQLGFMHIEPPKPLSEGDLKNFLDNSKNGVIYMSLGSNVQSKDLKPEIHEIFLRVFGSLNFDVLWKFENENLPNKPKNVKISKWLPQADLLAHPKIKLFITQGGQQSMEEAIDRTIPLIVIPFLGDQYANSKRMVDKKIGYHLELDEITDDKLKTAINEMLQPKYKTNIKNLRDLVYDEPMSSRDRAVWWTEYVIRHKGAKHLEYLGNHVPFYQRYWLDFIFISVLIIFTISKF